MKVEEREIKRKKRVLDYAVESGNVAKTCGYFGIPRSSFYRWRNMYLEHGEEGLRCKKPVAKSHPNQTPDEIGNARREAGQSLAQGSRRPSSRP